MANRTERVAIQQDGLVTALKDMPVNIAKPIETICKGRLQPAHTLHQVRMRRLDAQVVVVAH